MAYQYRIGEIINKDEMRTSPADHFKSRFLAPWEREEEIKIKMPTYTAPELEAIPEYTAPEEDTRSSIGRGGGGGSRIGQLTSQLAAPGIRSLRLQAQQIAGQHFANPNAKKMTLRQALAGYGAGLESVVSGARAAAGQEVMAEKRIAEGRRQSEERMKAEERRAKEREARMEYQTEVMRIEEENRRREKEAERKYQQELMEYYAEKAKQEKLTPEKKEVTPIRYAGASAPKSKPPDYSQYAKAVQPKSSAQPASYDLSTLLSTGGGGYEPAPLISDEEWESYYKS